MEKDPELTGVPIAALIAAPLRAAAEASLELAEASARYIQTVGFDKQGQSRQVNFLFERPREDEQGQVFMEEVHVQLPLLAIAPGPNLQIDSVDVDFNLEIRSNSTEAGKESGEARENAADSNETDVVKQEVHLNAVTTSHREHTRETDKNSKYSFKIRATNHGVPEALARVMDMLASGVAPHKTIRKTNGDPGSEAKGGSTGPPKG